jgi:hypothetical protein
LSRNSEVWSFYTSGRFDVNETVGNNFNRKIVLKERPKQCERVNWKVRNYKITLYHEQRQVKNDDHLLLISQWGCGSVFPNSQIAHIPAHSNAQSHSYSSSYARSNSSSVYKGVGTPTTEVVEVEINTSECVKVPSPAPVPIPRPITPPKPCSVCNENVSNDEYKRYYDSLSKGSAENYSNNNTSTYNNYTPVAATSNYNYDTASYNVSAVSNNDASAYQYNSAYNQTGNTNPSYNNNSANYYETSSYNYDSSSYNYDDQSYVYDEDSYVYDDQYNPSVRRY